MPLTVFFFTLSRPLQQPERLFRSHLFLVVFFSRLSGRLLVRLGRLRLFRLFLFRLLLFFLLLLLFFRLLLFFLAV